MTWPPLNTRSANSFGPLAAAATDENIAKVQTKDKRALRDLINKPPAMLRFFTVAVLVSIRVAEWINAARLLQHRPSLSCITGCLDPVVTRDPALNVCENLHIFTKSQQPKLNTPSIRYLLGMAAPRIRAVEHVYDWLLVPKHHVISLFAEGRLMGRSPSFL
jgi:hypothetical protein